MSKKIEDRRAKGLFWDAAWKLIEGCTKVSPGCDNCWSETETMMRSAHPNGAIRLRAREVIVCSGGEGFDGRVLLRHDNLDLPLRTKKPTVYAVWNDLYHEDVPDDFRDRAYAVMALCPQHTFLVLTKRAERMAAYMTGRGNSPVYPSACSDEIPAEENVPVMVRVQRATISYWRGTGRCGWIRPDEMQWPLSNVWHGVTCEDQQRADERIPHLLRVPGNRFLSLEPLLGRVDLMNLSGPGNGYYQCLTPIINDNDSARGSIHAVLLGGESGPNARPMHPAWVKLVRDQCDAAYVPFFFKQWGEWFPMGLLRANGRDLYLDLDGSTVAVNDYVEGKGKDPVRMVRIGKKTAGRHLQGCTHDSLPWGGAK